MNNNTKMDATMKALLVLAIITALLISSLLLYKVFVYDKKDNTKDNDIINKDNNKEVKDKDNYYSYKDTDEINSMVELLDYSVITSKIDHDNMLRKYYISTILLDKLKPVTVVDNNTKGHKDDAKDSLGNTYKKYKTNSIQYVLKDLGLTVDEIEKWNNKTLVLEGNYHYELYNTDIIKEKYPNMYKEIFNESFEISVGDIPCENKIFLYDKDVDKIVINVGSGCTSDYGTKAKIIDSSLKNDIYKVSFVKGYFKKSENNTAIITINGKDIELKDNNFKDILFKNKDALVIYTLTFKKENNVYTFDSIKSADKNQVQLELEKQNYTYAFDNNLKIVFNGTKSNKQENGYEYVLNISVKDKLISSNIFTNANDKVVYSSNFAASFKIYKIDSYYFLISSVAKQNDGDYVLIIDESGKIIKSFKDVRINIDEENKKYTITDCLTNNIAEECKKTNYDI